MTKWNIAIVVLAILGFGESASAEEKPIMRAATEIVTPGEVQPAPALAQKVLDALDSDDRAQLADCIAEKGLKPADYSALLRAVRVRNLWFVRPALEPYCFALYGAHLFRYFLFEEQASSQGEKYRLVFKSAGDFFAIYPHVTNGLNDIEATGCTAAECESERLVYDGAQYQAARCNRTEWRNGKEITEPTSCS